MITQPAHAVEPWCARETALNLDVQAQSESVFTLVKRSTSGGRETSMRAWAVCTFD
jgi:hypothetical protein